MLARPIEELDSFVFVPRVLPASDRRTWMRGELDRFELPDRSRRFLYEIGVPTTPIEACQFRLSEKSWLVSRRTDVRSSALPFSCRIIIADLIPFDGALEKFGDSCREICLSSDGVVFMVDISRSWQGVWPSPARYVSANLETFVAQLALVVDFMNNPQAIVRRDFVPKYVERFKQELCVMDSDALRDDTTYWQDAIEEMECSC
ncbi:MAG: SUKH-4 family immunity protein [Phycisphaerales bacterium]|nr:SUKH-4 family immunity protein [Phycisphaerales bacterium]MCB9857694.1 SUKH-4 family immunity protein [Phycisphaerales bacterium]MCB9864783.1 SUKH-4 family immunity protein [Phycisphaerales bacterium]